MRRNNQSWIIFIPLKASRGALNLRISSIIPRMIEPIIASTHRGQSVYFFETAFPDHCSRGITCEKVGVRGFFRRGLVDLPPRLICAANLCRSSSSMRLFSCVGSPVNTSFKTPWLKSILGITTDTRAAASAHQTTRPWPRSGAALGVGRSRALARPAWPSAPRSCATGQHQAGAVTPV